MAWNKNGTPSTLTGTADVMTISDLTAKKFNIILTNIIASGQVNATLKLNNDTGTKYSWRYQDDGTADGTGVSQTTLESDYGFNTYESFKVSYICSISGEEKLCISWEISDDTAGAGTAPYRREWVAKYVPSPDANITRIDWNNAGTGDMAIGSNVSALGSN